MSKAYFFPRFLAYGIDILIVSLVATLLCYFVPVDNYNALKNELTGVQQKYLNHEISEEEYINQTALISYDLDYASVPSYIIQVSLTILYFVVFQFYRNGQTIGKKLMKIQVVSDGEHKLTINDYLFRAVIINSLLTNILMIVFVLFMSRDYYFYASLSLQIIQFVLSLVTIFMVLIRKDGRGLHDFLSHSRVVMQD